MSFAVKDLFDVIGTPTGAGNPDRLADSDVATAHAPTVKMLLEAGADLWGKTVTDELAFSLSGTNVHYGTPINIRAPGRVPGGSSSGSAAAVSGGTVDVSLGTDTGGLSECPRHIAVLSAYDRLTGASTSAASFPWLQASTRWASWQGTGLI
jgi:amidase